MRKARVYAVYKGDEFIDLGTIEEMVERLGIAKRTFYFYRSIGYRRRCEKLNTPYSATYYIIEVEDD
jgi:hypothetical protein